MNQQQNRQPHRKLRLHAQSVIETILRFPFSCDYDYDVWFELFQRNRKQSRRVGRKKRPITSRFTVLYLREMEKFSKVAKMAVLGNSIFARFARAFFIF